MKGENKMKIKKSIVYPLVLFSIFFFGTSGVLISMNSIDKQTEKNTTEFMATVTNVETTYTGEKIHIEIYTEEYDDTLHISTNVSKKIDMDDINNLKKGQKILFRIQSNMLEQFKNTGFGNIVSLKTSEKEIFSLISYNKYIHDSALPARIAGIVLASMFLLASIYFILLLKGINIFGR